MAEDAPTHDELSARLRELEDREARVARAEARIEAAVATQKEALRQREQRVEEERRLRAERAAEMTRRSAELDRRERELGEREEQLERRLGELEKLVVADRVDVAAVRQRLTTLRAILRERVPDADADEAPATDTLAARERALDLWQQGLERQARELDERERRMDAEAAVAKPAEAAPQPIETSPDSAANVQRLRRLIAEHGERFTDRRDEWAYYLDALEPYADSSGTLPSRFDPLVADVFAPLLAAARA